MLVRKATFEWDENKNSLNKEKHNISFEEAQFAFSDTKRIIAKDISTVRKKTDFIVLVK